jgi:hypothetical protein
MAMTRRAVLGAVGAGAVAGIVGKNNKSGKKKEDEAVQKKLKEGDKIQKRLKKKD